MVNLNDVKVLYIVAHGHSGTTLLDTLVGNMPDAISTGELERISEWAVSEDVEKKCTCGDRIDQCPLWGDVCDHLIKRSGASQSRLDFWRAFDTRQGDVKTRIYTGIIYPILLMLSNAKILKLFKFNHIVNKSSKAAENSWALYDAISASSGNSLIVDSSKSPLRMKALYLLRPKSFYVIHLVRDGRAVVASYQRRLPKSVACYAKEWRTRFFYRWIMLLTVKSDRKKIVKYEDLATNPEMILKDICSFLNVSGEYVESSLKNPVGITHNISGNPARLNKAAMSNVVLDKRWMKEMSDNDVSIFNRISGRLNRKLGYK